jgi:Tfp pilus assembly protein PilF
VICKEGTQSLQRIVVILLATTAMCAAANAGPGSTSAPPVILISIDTLRADHLSCYGYRKIATPHFDALAEQGTRFVNVEAPVPMTLPSHTSLMTSTYPFVHGVEENGERVQPNALTIASILKSRGYRTAAFVGGYVLDRQFGLDLGFDLYDSPFNVNRGPGEEIPQLKRKGETVVQAVLQWLGTNVGAPFFLFVHLYDLHQPYTRPPAEGRSGYDTELSYVDEVLGKFWDGLREKSLFKNSLIVLTSDHGESLGEHGEKTHGYFIYESTLRVPLIVHWPRNGQQYPARVDTVASLMDVAPTILAVLGMSRPAPFQGQNLLGSLDGKRGGIKQEEIYSESLYAHDHLNCSPLRSLRIGALKYIDAPKPELYDLAEDPGEQRNLYEPKHSVAAEMQRRLHALQSRYEGLVHEEGRPNAEAISRLRSLGYLGAATGSQPNSGPDPKDRLAEYLQYGDAIRFVSNGDLQQAIRAFHSVLQKDEKNVPARFDLAACFYRLQRFGEAVDELRKTLTFAPDYYRAEELLGTIWLQQRDYAKAREQFTHLLTIAPQNYGAHFNLGILAMREGKSDDALRELHAAAAVNPRSAPVHEALGSLYFGRRDLEHASNEFKEAIKLDPRFLRAHYNLGRVLVKEQRTSEAAQEFRNALAIDPHFDPARTALHAIESSSDGRR